MYFIFIVYTNGSLGALSQYNKQNEQMLIFMFFPAFKLITWQ